VKGSGCEVFYLKTFQEMGLIQNSPELIFNQKAENEDL